MLTQLPGKGTSIDRVNIGDVSWPQPLAEQHLDAQFLSVTGGGQCRQQFAHYRRVWLMT